MRVQKQTWADFDLYVIIHPHGVAHLEIYHVPLNEYIGDCKAYFCNLWVDAEYRKQGVGNELLNKAEEIALENGLDSIALKHDNRESEAWVAEWYIRKGFDEKSFGRDGAFLVKKLRK